MQAQQVAQSNNSRKAAHLRNKMHGGGSSGGHHGLDLSGVPHGPHHSKTLGSPTTAPSLNDKFGGAHGPNTSYTHGSSNPRAP